MLLAGRDEFRNRQNEGSSIPQREIAAASVQAILPAPQPPQLLNSNSASASSQMGRQGNHNVNAVHFARNIDAVNTSNWHIAKAQLTYQNKDDLDR